LVCQIKGRRYHKPRVFENRMLREVFGSKREERSGMGKIL
jgi:hypothetical protein